MEILKNLEPLMIAGITLSGLFATAKCFFDKRLEHIPIILFFMVLIIGFTCNPAILPKLGNVIIIYICNTCNIEGVV